MTELRVPAGLVSEEALAAARVEIEQPDEQPKQKKLLSGACVFCGDVVDPDGPLTYRRVVGFERHRDAGGTNALRLRQPLEEFACYSCVDRAANGLLHQPTLDELAEIPKASPS